MEETLLALLTTYAHDRLATVDVVGHAALAEIGAAILLDRVGITVPRDVDVDVTVQHGLLSDGRRWTSAEIVDERSARWALVLVVERGASTL